MNLYLAYDAEFCTAYEIHDVAHFIAVGHLLFYLYHGIEDAGLSVEDQSVGVGNVVLCLLVNAMVGEHL